MMIDIINKFFKDLDYKYIYFIKEIKSLFNEAFLIFYIYRKIKVYLPYFFYKLNRKIEIFLKKNIYIPFIHRYKKIKYTIFTYPKYYNNFKFIEYIRKNIKNDYDNILDYYLNIFHLYKWKYNLFLFILILLFYSILLITNNLLYFIIFKFMFYTMKYIFKYIFLITDFFFFTYLNFTRIPKFFLGLPYLLIIKNIYVIYNIIFNILPLSIFISYWWSLYYEIKILFIKKINRFLDIIEFSILLISKSYIFVLFKRWLYIVKYYLMEENKFKELIISKRNYIKIYYNSNIKYNILSSSNFKIILYFIYIYNNFTNKIDLIKKIKEIYLYFQYFFPYFNFIIKIKILYLYFNFKSYFIYLCYKYYIYMFINNSFNLYYKYSIMYNINIFLLYYMNKILSFITYIINIFYIFVNYIK